MWLRNSHRPVYLVIVAFDTSLFYSSTASQIYYRSLLTAHRDIHQSHTDCQLVPACWCWGRMRLCFHVSSQLIMWQVSSVLSQQGFLPPYLWLFCVNTSRTQRLHQPCCLASPMAQRQLKHRKLLSFCACHAMSRSILCAEITNKCSRILRRAGDQ